MIEQGEVGFALVDTAAVGYSPDWQAPAGKTVDLVTLADYEAESGAWTCQTTSGALTPSPNTTTSDVPPTFCKVGTTTPTPGETTFTLDLAFLQDPNVAAGLSAYLYENDTKEAFAYFGMNNGEPPRMAGRVRLAAGVIGGDARTTLVATVSLPLVRRPDIEFGDATTSTVVPGVTAANATKTAASTRSRKTTAAA